MYLGTQKSESGVCSLSCFPVVRHRKSPGCAWVLLALIRHCPWQLFSLQGMWAPRPLWYTWHFHCVKTICCPNNQETFGVSVRYSLDVGSFLDLLPWTKFFQPFCCVCKHLSSQKQGLKEQFLLSYQEYSRDLCVAMYVFFWWDVIACKDKGVYSVYIFLCLHVLSFPLFKLLGS